MTGEPGAGGRHASTEMADAVAAAALSVPGVTGLHAGAFGQAATYYPGRTVEGVQLRPESTTVHLVLAWGVPLRATAASVREAVAAVTHGPVHVVVEDLAAPAGTTERRVT